MPPYRKAGVAVLVVIDTNLLNGDYLFASALLKVILAERAFGYSVAVSEVTVWEHAKHYLAERRDAAKLLRKLEGASAGLPEMDQAKARELIRQRAEGSGLRVLPLPSVDHRELLDRAQHGKPPFSQDGHQGYADALIWESLKVAAGSEEVLFLANDGDFGKDQLAKDLEVEAKTLPNQLTKLRAYREFIETYINPRREVLGKTQSALKNGSAAAEIVVLNRAAAAALTGLRLPGASTGMSSHYIQVQFSPPQVPIELVSVEVRPLGDSQIHLRLSFIARVGVVGEYWFNDDPKDEDSVACDWDEFDAKLLVEADAVAPVNLASVDSFTISSVESTDPDERDIHGE